jgi:hypothetical protein
LQIAPTPWKGIVDALFPVFRVRTKRRLFRLSAGDRLADRAIGQNLPALRAQPLPERGPLPDHSPRSEVRTGARIGHIDRPIACSMLRCVGPMRVGEGLIRRRSGPSLATSRCFWRRAHRLYLGEDLVGLSAFACGPARGHRRVDRLRRRGEQNGIHSAISTIDLSMRVFRQRLISRLPADWHCQVLLAPRCMQHETPVAGRLLRSC